MRNEGDIMVRAFAEIAFTPAVRAIQERLGSAAAYAKFLAPEAERGDHLGPREAAFIAERDGFYQATVSSIGWPYVQFRGGPAGFLKVLNELTIAYADFRGNRQYLSSGNLADDDRISLILMDYAHGRRLKIWGRAKLIDISADPSLLARLHDPSYRARPERAVVITVEAFDWNCPQHIPQRLTVEEMEPYFARLRDQITRLDAENRSLRAALGDPSDLQPSEVGAEPVPKAFRTGSGAADSIGGQQRE
jgi:predicted pyridoxine 5'-phosphate oxidase superfamily flavin-nucleotide-binding protein